MASQAFSIRGLEHHVVALEAIHVPMPAFAFPAPYKVKFTAYHTTSRAELPERVRDATVIICTGLVRMDAETLDPAVTPALQFIAAMASGTDHIDLEAARRRGIRVCNCPRANIDAVSESAVALYFSARKSLTRMHALTVNGDHVWKARGSIAYEMRDGDGQPPLTCAEEVMGIIGYGALGKRIAVLARALGMKVLIAERKGVPSPAQDPSVQARGDRTPFEQVLRESSVIVVSCPRIPETVNMLSTAEFTAMRKCAVVVNVARGGIVDEDALVDALQARQIFGYATDVFRKEPVGSEEDSPLVSARARSLNVTCSPHVAWFSGRTMSTLQQLLKGVVEAWFAKEPQNIIV